MTQRDLYPHVLAALEAVGRVPELEDADFAPCGDEVPELVWPGSASASAIFRVASLFQSPGERSSLNRDVHPWTLADPLVIHPPCGCFTHCSMVTDPDTRLARHAARRAEALARASRCASDAPATIPPDNQRPN